MGGPTEMKHIKHVKPIIPANMYINQLHDYSEFGRKTTHRINPNQILDLHWKLANTYHTTNTGQSEIGNTTITVKTFDYVCKTSLSTETCTTQSRREPTVCSVIPII